jgi:dipeptidyl aminopeptidase/acylaminoacyl peptidase
VRWSGEGAVKDVTPPPYNVRTRVHEYGGGSFLVAEGRVYFTNFADQRLYRQDGDGEPQPLSRADGMRYADFVLDRRRGRLIAVREDHTGTGEPANTIVAVDIGTGEERVLVAGNDFYAAPRLSPDGSRLAWLAWDHPNMPWDGTTLWLAELNDTGDLVEPRVVAGGPNEAVFQPEWSPGGTLYFVSDPKGWWNLFRLAEGRVQPVLEMEAEFGRPLWAFGTHTYVFQSEDRIICTYTRHGTWRLATLETATGRLVDIDTAYTDFGALSVNGDRLAFIGGSPLEPRSVVLLDLQTNVAEVIKRSVEVGIDPGYLARPEPVQFPTGDGEHAHALYYAPTNKDFRPPEGERPPLIVHSHGGPTGATSSTLSLSTQFWTSRGFAVLDVNYRGSTGYGRQYRDALKGTWGVADVEDCTNGALHLVARGLADRDRLAISGGSAGGYTTLCALAFRSEFKAGASHFGVADLEALAKETHKFESRYLDSLIGPYPERRDLYLDRSPIHHVEGLNCPVIFLQGLEDKIVPPDQAEAMVQALRRKGVPVAYLPFEGEQHGFRRAENIKRALDAELYFYSRIFGFGLAEPVDPVEIENLHQPH